MFLAGEGGGPGQPIQERAVTVIVIYGNWWMYCLSHYQNCIQFFYVSPFPFSLDPQFLPAILYPGWRNHYRKVDGIFVSSLFFSFLCFMSRSAIRSECCVVCSNLACEDRNEYLRQASCFLLIYLHLVIFLSAAWQDFPVDLPHTEQQKAPSTTGWLIHVFNLAFMGLWISFR